MYVSLHYDKEEQKWVKSNRKTDPPLCGAEGPKICHQDDIDADIIPDGSVVWNCSTTSKQNVCQATCTNGADADKVYKVKCQNKKNTWKVEKKKMTKIDCS